MFHRLIDVYNVTCQKCDYIVNNKNLIKNLFRSAQIIIINKPVCYKCLKKVRNKKNITELVFHLTNPRFFLGLHRIYH